MHLKSGEDFYQFLEALQLVSAGKFGRRDWTRTKKGGQA
jgi:hypothetical protein